MKKYAFAFLLSGAFSRAFADVVVTKPTGSPSVDYTLMIGVFAVVVLLIVWRIRKRRQM